MQKLVSELLESSTRASSVIAVNRGEEANIFLLTLYATIMELCDTGAALVRTEKRAGIKTVVRSLIEAWVDFSALLLDADYLNNMKAAYHNEWKKLLEEGAGHDNPFLAGLRDHDRFDETLVEHRRELQRLNDRGVRVLNHLQRFERAGMRDVYRSVYNMLSAESHNNIRALIDRHAQTRDGILQLRLFGPPDPSDTEIALDTIAGILLGSTQAIHERFETGRVIDFAGFDTRLVALRVARDGAKPAPDARAGDDNA